MTSLVRASFDFLIFESYMSASIPRCFLTRFEVERGKSFSCYSRERCEFAAVSFLFEARQKFPPANVSLGSEFVQFEGNKKKSFVCAVTLGQKHVEAF